MKQVLRSLVFDGERNISRPCYVNLSTSGSVIVKLVNILYTNREYMHLRYIITVAAFGQLIVAVNKYCARYVSLVFWLQVQGDTVVTYIILFANKRFCAASLAKKS